MQAHKLMTKKVRAIRPDDDLATALKTLVAAGGRHLAVVDGKRLVGIVSQWDILRAYIRKPNGDVRVAKFMTGNVHTTTSKETLDNLVTRMVEERVGCLPVVDDDELVGMVDVNDVIVAMAARPTAKPSTKATLKTKTAHPRAR